jgi:4'-phosphopantetheinyl transferase
MAASTSQTDSEPGKLDATGVHVWPVWLDGRTIPFALAKATLSADERQRAERFQNDQARKRFVMSRAALRTILSQYLGCLPSDIAFKQGASGKPRLGGMLSRRSRVSMAKGDKNMLTSHGRREPGAQPEEIGELRFNVAHSGQLALVAVAAQCEVGVDVEQLRTVGHFEQIAKRYFHPQEIATLAATPSGERAAAFLRCWTCKEAILKAVGVGVAGPLDKFAVPFDQDGEARVDVDASGITTCWLQRLEVDAAYVGAIACVGQRRRVRLVSLADEGVQAGGDE